jgi:hypothetical protein
VVMAYSILFFIGYLIFTKWSAAGISGAVALLSFGLLIWSSNKVSIFADAPREQRPEDKKVVY